MPRSLGLHMGVREAIAPGLVDSTLLGPRRKWKLRHPLQSREKNVFFFWDGKVGTVRSSMEMLPPEPKPDPR